MLAIDYGADGVVVISGRLDASQCPAAQKFLEHAGSSGKLRLTGVSRHLQDIFLYSGFDQIFEIEPAR